jgi:hypothetical protein
MVANIVLGFFVLGIIAAIVDIIREGYKNKQDFRDFHRRDRDRWR